MFSSCNTSIMCAGRRFAGLGLAAFGVKQAKVTTSAWPAIVSAKLRQSLVVPTKSGVLETETEHLRFQRKVQPMHLKYFINLMGTSRSQALRLLAVNSELNVKTLFEIEKSLLALQDLGIGKSEIISNIEILALHAKIIKRRFQCLKEIGISPLGAPEIIRYPKILACDTQGLHGSGVLPKSVTPLQLVLDHPLLSDRLRDRIIESSMSNSKMPMQSMRIYVTTEVLQHYFDCNLTTAKQMAEQMHKLSLCFVVETAQILRDDLKVPFSTIQKIPNLLGIDPQAIYRIRKILSGHKIDLKSMVTLAADSHLVLLKDPDWIALHCRNFSDYGIPMSLVATTPNIFLSSPEFVLNGLVTFSSWPEFPVLKLQPSFLNLLKSYKRVSRIYKRYLTKSELELNSNLDLLTKDDVELSKLLGHCERLGSQKSLVRPYCVKTYMLPFLADKLGCTAQEVKKHICRHPLFSKTPVVNVRTTLSFLFEAGFQPEQIVRGLALVFYPKARVAEALLQLPTLTLEQPYEQWKKSPHILQLLLYTIEKDEGNFFQTLQSPDRGISATTPTDKERTEKETANVPLPQH